MEIILGDGMKMKEILIWLEGIRLCLEKIEVVYGWEAYMILIVLCLKKWRRWLLINDYNSL